jgi:hypothetical protein
MFLLYFLVKIPSIVLAFHDIWHGLEFSEHVMYGLWSENDSAIFAGILGFYFGSRHMMKMR